MAVWAIPLAMMAAGAYKGMQDQERAKQDRKMEAELARWSPWTGIAPQRVQGGSGVLGGALQGGMTGLSFSQALENSGYGKEKAASSGADNMASQDQTQQAPAQQQMMLPPMQMQQYPQQNEQAYAQMNSPYLYMSRRA